MKKTLLAVWVMLGAGTAWAAPCTPGTDCYCDRVKNPSAALYDPARLHCEDFEAPTLYENVTIGGGYPFFGPWYDDSGWPGDRGHNSYWTKTYGQGSGIWVQGQPASPTVGTACTAFATCWSGAFKPGDPWQANSFAKMGILRKGDFNFEIPTLGDPMNAAGGASGAFDGKQSFAVRVLPGQSGGFLGTKSYTPTRHIGITYAIAYAANLEASGVLGGPWKHTEWRQNYQPNMGFDGLSGFYGDVIPINTRPPENFPFYGFILLDLNNASRVALCSSAKAAATVNKGSIDCAGDYMQFYGDSSVYKRSVNFPYGSWGCIRTDWDFSNPTASSVKWWFQGPGMTSEILVLDVGNLNTAYTGAACPSCTGWDQINYNVYANTNQGTSYGYQPSVQTSYRYEDNYHVRAGTPVSCSQLGFGGSTPADNKAPAKPRNLRFR